MTSTVCVDTWSSDAPPARARGALDLAFRVRDGRTAAVQRAESGCLKVRLPRVPIGSPPTAVLLNTAGGITAGDRLDLRVRWEAGTEAAVTTQAAERLYRADHRSAPARIRNHLVLGPGASGEWLPQETILFDGCRVDRRLEVELAADCAFLGIETLVFGRTAMGERLRSVSFRDAWDIRRAGRLLISERVRLEGAVSDALARPAVARGGAAVATILAVQPGRPGALEAIRSLPAPIGCETAASEWEGVLAVRFVARDSWSLRQAVLPVLAVLRHARPVPSCWQPLASDPGRPC